MLTAMGQGALRARAEAAELLAKTMAADEWRTSNKAWEAFKNDALQGGASLGHKLTKPPIRWKPQVVLQDNGTRSASLPAQLADQAAQWGGLWNVPGRDLHLEAAFDWPAANRYSCCWA